MFSEIKTTHHHPGLELDANTMTYKIKEGYVLPITATQYTPNGFFGHRIQTLTGHLSERLTFNCDTEDCSVISSRYYPTTTGTKDTGICFGKKCVENDWYGLKTMREMHLK